MGAPRIFSRAEDQENCTSLKSVLKHNMDLIWMLARAKPFTDTSHASVLQVHTRREGVERLPTVPCDLVDLCPLIAIHLGLISRSRRDKIKLDSSSQSVPAQSSLIRPPATIASTLNTHLSVSPSVFTWQIKSYPSAGGCNHGLKFASGTGPRGLRVNAGYI